jgi:hypothetical protein
MKTHPRSASVSGTARSFRSGSGPAVSPPALHFSIAVPLTEAQLRLWIKKLQLSHSL